MLNTKLSRWLRVSGLGSVALISSCASTQQLSPTPYHDYSNINYLPATLSFALHSAQVGQQFTASESPWGGQAVIYVLERYFSASGKNCMKLEIRNQNKSAVVCEYQENWVLNPDIVFSEQQG